MAGDIAAPNSPVTPPLSTHGTHLNHNPDAGVPRRPTQGRFANASIDNAVAEAGNDAVVQTNQIPNAPYWTGPASVSGELADPEDPFVMSPSGSTVSNLTAAAPVFVPKGKRDGDGDSGSPSAGSNGGASNGASNAATAGAGTPDNKSHGFSTNKTSDTKGGRSNKDNDTPVIVNGANGRQLTDKAKGKQPVKVSPRPTSPTRFMVVDNVKASDFDQGTPMSFIKASPSFNESINKLGVFELVPSPLGNGSYTLFIFCDSLSIAKETFSILKQFFPVAYLTKEAFLESKVPIPEHVGRLAAVINITSAVKQSSLHRGITIHGITEMTKTVAAMFGRIISFSLIDTKSPHKVTYRVEYDSVNDAYDAILNTRPGVDINCGRHEHLSVTTQDFEPSSHLGSPRSVSSGPSGLGSPNGDRLEYSGTGRTATRLGPNGKKSTMQGYKQPGPAPKPGPATPTFQQGFASPMFQGHFPGTPHFNNYPDGIYQPTNVFADMSITSPDGQIGHTPQDVIDIRVEQGQDCRTTLMIRNVPPEWTAELLEQTLISCVPGEFDFAYNRIDFRQNQSVGYAFVNFISTTALLKYVRRWRGQLLSRNIYRRHQKPCAVSYANVQGYECLVAKFRNSSILDEAKGCRPRLFWSKETAPAAHLVGQEREWPGVDNQAKKQRSLENANIQGLYAPRSRGNGGRGGRRGGHRSNFDLGTPSHRNQTVQNINPALSPNYHYGNPAYNMYDPYAQPRTIHQMGWMNQQYGFQGPVGPGSMLRTDTNGQLGARPTAMPLQVSHAYHPDQAFMNYPGNFEPLLAPVKGQPARHYRPA